MNTLLVDEGNTRVKYALAESDKINQIRAIELDDLAIANVLPIKKIIIASVKAESESIIHQLKLTFPQADMMQIHTQSRAFGLMNAYSDYTRLGIDRWLAMLGAKVNTNNAFIVLDAGTAVTVDAVNQQGHHLGGWILPNVNFSAESLAQRSGKIELIKPSEANIQLGKITEECVYNGLYASHIYLINSLYQQLVDSEAKVEVYLTGGDASIYHQLLNELNVPNQRIDNLVFVGMSLYA